MAGFAEKAGNLLFPGDTKDPCPRFPTLPGFAGAWRKPWTTTGPGVSIGP